MLDTWKFTADDYDVISSGLRAEVEAAYTRDFSVYAFGSPTTGEILAVFAYDGNAEGLPLVISGDKLLVEQERLGDLYGS